MESKYERRGVSASKDEVHNALKGLDKGLYPSAFCKILPDLFGDDPSYCSVIHSDGAGTKSSLAYMYWKQTGDLSVWRGIAQDAVAMNTEDLLCVGVTGPVVLSSTIGRNKRLIPGEVITEIIQGTEAFLDFLRSHGLPVFSGGGETADVGDLVRTIIVDSTVSARMRREEVISNDAITPGDYIVGFSSYGQANYENSYNGGIGSNGLTSARHDLFGKKYSNLFPESYDSGIDTSVVYNGPFDLNSPSSVNGVNMGKLLLSPTRTYVPILIPVIKEFRKQIHGMIHCSGGGQTKVMHFVRDLKVVKDNLLEIPPLFRYIKESSGSDWKEMFQVFNMGHRMEIYLPDLKVAEEIINSSRSKGVEAQIIGHCEPADHKSLVIRGEFGELNYQ